MISFELTGQPQWYKFARLRKVYNVDSFTQITSDLRPFWSLPPATVRHYAAHASDDSAHEIGVISVRDGQVFQESFGETSWWWRAKTFVRMLRSFAAWLPDMDIPMNGMDQPRVVVPLEEMQEMVRIEEASRSLSDESVKDAFTKNQTGLWRQSPNSPKPRWWDRWNPFYFPKDRRNDPGNPHPVYGWFPYANRPFMDLASAGCPPDSYARNPASASHRYSAELSYKTPTANGSFIINTTVSTDLCTVGPILQRLHGFLYASTSMLPTQKLIPIFSECKTSVNNDILFPANMYWTGDKRYVYSDEQDINWDDKDDVVIWRGVTSGGTAFAGDELGWRRMQRQRLVALTNGTALGEEKADILALADEANEHGHGSYEPTTFVPGPFAKHHTDTGFTEKAFCIPNCSFYNSTFTMLKQTSFAETFRNKYLIDVDGHSFSGRWRAFLQSRSLGLKATIFREWHDERLWAWRHYVPVDNTFNELYSLLTYFIGLPTSNLPTSGLDGGLSVPRHDYEAYHLATQGREWAAQVLRREDMEIYLFRLLLEYGRVVDDNRDFIGVVGDGGEEMREFDERVLAV